MARGLRRIVLVSASPRRRALLQAAGFDVVVRASHVDESWPGGELDDGVMALSERKLNAVGSGEDIALAADTQVVIDGVRLGKPESSAEAEAMLRQLAGREHIVVTGFCVRRGARVRRGAVRTRVWFRAVAGDEIARYLATGEPFDKAGAYAIQGEGGALVDRIEGSYTNVVGLPLAEVLAAIEEVS